MQYIGLLTDEQKRAGYFVTQDSDFMYLWHRRHGNPDCIAIFLYDTARVKEIRDAANVDGGERWGDVLRASIV